MSRTTPALPAAAVLLLVCVLAAPASGDLIYDVGAIPNPFSPNADGVFDSTAVYYSLSEPADIVVSVADSLGNGLWTLWSDWEETGVHSHWWDGWFGDSLGVDGEYRFLVKAVPQPGPYEEETAEFPFTVDTVAPAIESFEVAPSRFSPDGDGVGDSLVVSFAADVSEPSDQVLIRASDEDDTTVRLIYSATGTQSAVLFWDGRDDGGAVAADGLYYITAETRDAAGNSSASGALVDLDTAPPVIGVEYPDTTDVYRVDEDVADVVGWAFDRAGVVGVEYTMDGEEWISAAITRGDTVEWTASVACTACVPDSVDSVLEIAVRAHDGTPTADGEGHVNTPSTSVPPFEFDIIFDVAPPEHVSTTVSGGDDTFTPGETVTITTMWDDSGYDIAADFSLVDSEFDPANVQVSESSGNRYTVTYEISQGSTHVPVTDAPVAVTATDHFSRSVSDTTVTVSVVRGGSDGPAGLTVSANSFRPLASESVVIGLGSYAGETTIRVYSMAGALVRTLAAQGASSIEWRGDNGAGDTVASGVYFLAIETEDGESVRKVAVLK